jgi:hypothetical protein
MNSLMFALQTTLCLITRGTQHMTAVVCWLKLWPGDHIRCTRDTHYTVCGRLHSSKLPQITKHVKWEMHWEPWKSSTLQLLCRWGRILSWQSRLLHHPCKEAVHLRHS